jgi:hypothetical protein
MFCFVLFCFLSFFLSTCIARAEKDRVSICVFTDVDIDSRPLAH